jgi:hypothetical protein
MTGHWTPWIDIHIRSVGDLLLVVTVWCVVWHLCDYVLPWVGRTVGRILRFLAGGDGE